MDGIYLASITGRAGVSTLMLVIIRGMLVGVDFGRVRYDGEVRQTPSGEYDVSVVYAVPPGAHLVTGQTTGPRSMLVPLSFTLPSDFADGRVITIETPLGSLKARFEKLRDLGA